MRYRASKLRISTVNKDLEKKFLDENHYQGYCPSTFAFGLFAERDDDSLVQLMSFCAPRYTRKFDFELLRLCTRKDDTVLGGASRLLKHFMQDNPGSIISYCNRDKFDGSVYKALGFKSLGIRKGYHYEKDGIRYHRSCFTKKRCLAKWPEYQDREITERQIMAEQGYTRVEDQVGQETFVLDDDIKWYIYEIIIKNYHYIGQHRYRKEIADQYYGSGVLLKRFRDKLGVTEKKILIKNITSQEEANRLESLMIKRSIERYGKYNEGGLNLNLTVEPYHYTPNNAKRPGSFTGRKHTEETKAKISASGKGKHNHKGSNNPHFGHRASEETRKRISEAKKGKSSWNKGKKYKQPWREMVFESPSGERHTKREWAAMHIDVYYYGYKKLGRVCELTKS